MVKYMCQRCGFETQHKNNFRKHLNRKNICLPILKDLTKTQLLELNKLEESRQTVKASTQCQSNVNPKNKPKGLHVCGYCNKHFSTRQGKYKHMKKFCKVKKEKEYEVEEMKRLLSEKEKLISKMIQDNEDKNQIINKLIIELSNNTKTVHNNSHNKTVNIIINNYGEENTDYITEKTIKKLINKPGSAIQKLLKLIHFNEKYPENQNLKITNIHDPYIHIYDDGNWKIKKKGKVIDDIIVDKFDMIDINIDSDEEELVEKKKKLESKIVNREKDKFIVNEVTETIINQSKKIFNE